jgi:hypothetical protein
MRIYFCPECGSYSAYPGPFCDDCQAQIDEETWAEVTDEEIRQLDYIEEFDVSPGLPVWEYDVVKLKPDYEEGGLEYTTALLNRMGDKGWELVNVTPLGDQDGPRYGVFKRSWMSDYED